MQGGLEHAEGVILPPLPALRVQNALYSPLLISPFARALPEGVYDSALMP